MNCCNDFGQCHGGQGCPAREACAIDPMHPLPAQPMPALPSAPGPMETAARTLLGVLAWFLLLGLVVYGAIKFLLAHPRVLVWLWS